MNYRGQVKGGVVVFEQAPPPDGALVQVEVVESAGTDPSIWQKLKKYSGAVEGLPTDMARDHDHYIHGSPKK